MKAAISLTLLAGAYATDCSPGYTHKKVLTNLKCKSSAVSAKNNGADNCNTNCCQLNTKTCGGNAASITCATTKYMAKDGKDATQAQIDAWSGTATTAKTANTDCCTTKAKCSSTAYTCPAGQKRKTANAAKNCPTNDASCATATGTDACCEAATNTCGTAAPALACPTGSISGLQLAGTVVAAQNAWKTTTYTDSTVAATKLANKNAACCVAKPTCFSMKDMFSCPAGKKFGDTAGKTTITASNPIDYGKGGTDYSITTFLTKCCIADTDHCAGATVTCASGSYNAKDATVSVKSLTAAQINKKCCHPMAMCGNYTCPSGMKAKASAASTKCSGNAASCLKTTCCQNDLTTCGGNFPGDAASITCATGFYDERTFWTGTKAATQAVKDAWKLKNTSATTKTKDCCTAVANCTNITSTVAAGITTTPAAVVTTTPAAAALKFSEHKVAIDKKSSGSNMVWLGVGGLMGMGVLMVVQHMRSTRYMPVRDVTLE